MLSVTRVKPRFVLYLLLGSLLLFPSHARSESGAAEGDHALQAVIVVARHGVRAPLQSETRSNLYNRQPWPSWPVAPGLLTPHGARALRLLGRYYRARYRSLFGLSPSSACAALYVEADVVPRTVASAEAVLSGLAPDCRIRIHRPQAVPNPLFNPSTSDSVDQGKIKAATMGKMGNDPVWFANAFARPLARMRRVLLDCRERRCGSAKPDFRTAIKNSVAVEDDVTVVNPVQAGADFAENFLLEYTEGMPMDAVGWGRVSRENLNDLMEMNTRYHDFVLRTPYTAEVFASDLAAHIRDTLVSIDGGAAAKGRLGGQEARFILLEGYDSNLTTLGGLLRLHWLLPHQSFDATPPGSALVFELYRDRRTGAGSVRVVLISQTLDQTRHLRVLTSGLPPAVVPIFVPGCSRAAAGYPCTISDFARVVTRAVDPRFVEPVHTPSSMLRSKTGALNSN